MTITDAPRIVSSRLGTPRSWTLESYLADGGYRGLRAASFANLQGMAPMVRGALIADVIAIVSTIDPVLGDVDR